MYVCRIQCKFLSTTRQSFKFLKFHIANGIIYVYYNTLNYLSYFRNMNNDVSIAEN